VSRLRPNPSRCVLCPSTDRVEQNHIGGRNHLIWITAPFCLKHHNEFHLRLRLAGIDLRYTSDVHERHRRIRQAIYVVLQMLEECEKESATQNNARPETGEEVTSNAIPQSRGQTTMGTGTSAATKPKTARTTFGHADGQALRQIHCPTLPYLRIIPKVWGTR